MHWLFVMILLMVYGLNDLSAQRFLLLQRPGKVKNYKYFAGDKIIFRAYADTVVVMGRISGFSDTSIFINDKSEIPIEDITSISKKCHMMAFLSRGALLFGIAYFGLNGFNRLINHDYPTYDKESLLIVSGSLAGFFALNKFKYRKFRIGEEWKLDILDLTFERENFNIFILLKDFFT